MHGHKRKTSLFAHLMISVSFCLYTFTFTVIHLSSSCYLEKCISLGCVSLLQCQPHTFFEHSVHLRQFGWRLFEKYFAFWHDWAQGWIMILMMAVFTPLPRVQGPDTAHVGSLVRAHVSLGNTIFNMFSFHCDRSELAPRLACGFLIDFLFLLYSLYLSNYNGTIICLKF